MFVKVRFILYESLVIILVPLFVILHAIFLAISLPIYFYRWIIPKIISPQNGYDIGKPLCGVAEIMAKEILNPEEGQSPRCTIVSNVVIKGQLELKDFCHAVERNAILAITPSGQVKFPELTQYPVYRMGRLFWKDDTDFSMRNHIKLHVLDENESASYSERFLTETCERFLNNNFPLRRSPWEMLIVHNYKNSSFLTKSNEDNEKLTLGIVRMHHSLGDGFGFVNIFKRLFHDANETAQVAEKINSLEDKTKLNRFKTCVNIPIQILRECRRFISFSLFQGTVFHTPDSRKSWSQHYARANIISESKIKFIKDTFGVKFGTVIESSYMTALRKISMKILERKSCRIPDDILLGSVIPKPNHPGTLTLHAYSMVYPLPYGTDLSPVERLLICEERSQKLRNSFQPYFLDFLFKAYTEHWLPIAKIVSKNRFVPVFITNFRGPDKQFGKNRCLAYDFTAGGLIGDVGMGLSVFSFAGDVQISATADKCVMSREEINEFLNFICEEVDLLFELALKKMQKSLK